MMSYHYFPVGWLEISASNQALSAIRFLENCPNCANSDTNDLREEAIRQLDEYFKGNCTTFSIPLEPEGTPFQKSVWQELQKIAYGTAIKNPREYPSRGFVL